MPGPPRIILDFDSTLVKVESLEVLAAIALANDPMKEHRLQQIEAITNQAMRGELDFGEALSKRVSSLHLSRSHISTLAAKLPQLLSASIRRNLRFMQQLAKHVVVVSGGFVDYMRPTLRICGLEQVYANRFVFDTDGVVKGYDRDNPLAHAGGKIRVVRDIQCAQPAKGRTIVLGDGYTDYEIRAAGLADAFYVFTENVRRTSVVALAEKEIKQMEDFMQLAKEFFPQNMLT